MKEKTANLNVSGFGGESEPLESKSEGEEFVNRSPTINLLAGLAAVFLAVPVAFSIDRINAIWGGQPEKAVVVTGGLLGFLLLLPPAAYLIARRREAKVGEIGLIGIGTIGTLLVAVYLFSASPYVRFPADFLIWSESDFVNDILKFRQSYPIYTPDVNNESFIYAPGSQLATYFLAWVTGYSTSIQALRAIQVFYTLLAAIVALLCCRRLIDLSFGDGRKIASSPLWGVICLTGLFLIATNNLTNPFTHLLHNDALAQLVTVTAYWLLLEYEATKDRRILWLMALVPAAGFWVKQSLVVWAGLYVAYLLIFDRPRSFKKTTSFALAAFAAAAASFLLGCALWGNEFIYWIFTVLGKHQVSPLRSFKHLLDVWLYFAIGLAGGAVLLEIAGFKKLFGHWLIWLFIISTETYTSGIAWMLNHIGPGSLIAGIWFFAAVFALWTKFDDSSVKSAAAKQWLRAGVGTAVLCLIFSGLGVVRVPVAPFDAADAERYVGEIEREFSAQPPERTLLDFGSWVYLPSGIVMKDRAPTIGERGYSQTGDFSGILTRLEQKHYRKILVRNLHSPDFWYDHELWTRSSRIRQTLFENYIEVGSIRAVAGFKPNETPYGFSEISILVPRGD